MTDRLIAIGDIHGCDVAFAGLLSAIEVRPEDHLVVLGDFVDRGPNSRGVIERLLALDQQCQLTCLLGNHEEMLLHARDDLTRRAMYSWLPCGGAATLQSYGPQVAPEDLPQSHIDFIHTCRDFLETESHAFLHANFDPNTPFNRQDAYLLRWESLRTHMPSRHVSGKMVIVGHTSQKDGEVLDRDYLKCIDTYCYGGKYLTALEVYSGQLWQVDVEGNLRQ